ncbi:hypothetical protein ACFQ7Z_10520 [Streptomyces virginiae]|uniref:hypothetical protein n=1 Tax=Streptomyces virginiae TaxID=1961 RepID=UPI0036B25778
MAGRDEIILGYNDRTASIKTNADTVIDCIRRALAERAGRWKLVVGDFIRLFSGLLNSPAATQLARWYIAKADDTPEPAPERVAFLRELEELGG